MPSVLSFDPSSSLSSTTPASLRMFPSNSSRWPVPSEFSSNSYPPFFCLFSEALRLERHVPYHLEKPQNRETLPWLQADDPGETAPLAKRFYGQDDAPCKLRQCRTLSLQSGYKTFKLSFHEK